MMVSYAGKRQSNPMHFRFWRSPDIFDYAKKGPQTAQTSRWFAAHKGRLSGQTGPPYAEAQLVPPAQCYPLKVIQVLQCSFPIADPVPAANATPTFWRDK